jgi:hypothetical protein
MKTLLFDTLQIMKTSMFITRSFIATLGLALALTTHVQGATLKYWDIDGATAGAGGATPSGTWDTTTANWNTSSAGTSDATTFVSGTSTATAQTAVFCAGTDATGDYTITLGRNLSIYDLTVQDGNPTFDRSGSYGISVYNGKLTVNGSHIATFNIPWTGSGSIDKWGTGTAVYNGTSTMINYPWTLNEGTIAVGNNNAFGNGSQALVIGDSTGAKVVTLKSADATAHTIPNALTFNAANYTLDTGGDLTFSGAANVGSSAYVATSITVKNNSTFSGVWSGTAGISLNAASTGTLTLSGSGANTYGSATANGNTTVNAGTLKLNKAAGVNAIAKGIIVLTGGTLQLAAANQIADAVAMQLNGGTFNPAGNSETLGTLNLTGDSIISLGGTEAIQFADSHDIFWTAATTVTISGWSGSLAGGGANTIQFGTTSDGLTADQVAQVRFLDPAGVAAGTYNAKILSTGEVVPDIPTAPQISTCPTDQVVDPGSDATFTVAATGALPLSYQWSLNGLPIAGATDSSCIVSNVQSANAGSLYSVVVTNVFGSASCPGAQLFVAGPWEIMGQPRSQTNHVGAAATFTVDLCGTPPFYYQWYYNGYNVPRGGQVDSSSRTLVLTNLTTDDAGSYRVEVYGGGGDLFSAEAVLTVIPAWGPVITNCMQSQAVRVGSNVTFTVEAGGGPAPAYQWLFNGENIEGATGTSLAVANAQVTNAGTYSVAVVNTAGSNGCAATLAVVPPPTLTIAEQGADIVVGWPEPWVLQWATNASGPYSDTPSAVAPSYTNSTASGLMRFWRAR